MRDLKIALALPEGFTTSDVTIVTPDDVPTEGLAWTEKNGVVELHVRELEMWSMIVLEGRQSGSLLSAYPNNPAALKATRAQAK